MGDRKTFTSTTLGLTDSLLRGIAGAPRNPQSWEPMTPLQSLLATRQLQGPVLASEVMALALYHPEHGYYRRTEGPWGFEGKDYYTALDCGPLLGQALAARLEKVWCDLDRPTAFTVLEPGAGRGWLGRDLLTTASGDFADALVYLHRDDNPAARQAAEAALAPWTAKGKARFVGESEALPPFDGAVISNELFDALPAEPYRFRGAAWEQEALGEEGPVWIPADRDEAIQWFESQGTPEEGDGSVWAEALPSVLSELLAPLRRGLFLAIDYGSTAEDLLAKGADLRRYRAHQVDGQWWQDLGAADLTADVDFTRLECLVRTVGMADTCQCSLSAWIRAHAPLLAWEAGWLDLDARTRLERMQNLMQLTLPNLLGERFRVMEAWR